MVLPVLEKEGELAFTVEDERRLVRVQDGAVISVGLVKAKPQPQLSSLPLPIQGDLISSNCD